MWTRTQTGEVISTERQDGATHRLLAGRAFVLPGVNGHEAADEVTLGDVADGLRGLRDEVASRFVGRGEMADAIAVALACGEHLFAYGPPGTAKSSVLRLFAEGIGGGFWRIVLNPDTTREDIVGPLDPDALRQGKWRRRWAGLATADLAFLDEVWKASPQVANILLDALEERLVVAGDEERAIPLLSAVAASNEVPEAKEAQAAYDRFLVRLGVGYLRDPDEFRAMLTVDAGRSNVAANLTPDGIRLLAAAAEWEAGTPPEDLKDAMMELWREFGGNGHAVSDRRWRKTLKAAVANALLHGETPAPHHLSVARWTLWSEPDEESDIRNTVLGLTDPMGSEVLDAEALLADLKQEMGRMSGTDLSDRATLTSKARRLAGRVEKLLADSGSRPYKARLDAVKAEADRAVYAIIDTMAKVNGD